MRFSIRVDPKPQAADDRNQSHCFDPVVGAASGKTHYLVDGREVTLEEYLRLAKVEHQDDAPESAERRQG